MSFASRAQAQVALADTLQVTADREETAAIIREVGRRMREADQRAAPYAYTSITTRTEYYGDEGEAGTLDIVRTVSRQIRMKNQSVRIITLASTRRRYEGGALVREETRDEPGDARWRDPARPLLDALPFMPGAADRYDYQVVETRLVGNTLIYRIAFTPRNAFDPLPVGEVWVDYAGWVVRRLTARMDPDRSPNLLLKDVPLYRMKQERRSGLWLPVDVRMVMDLKSAPMTRLPRRVDLRVRITNVELLGDVDPVHAALVADRRDTSEFWLPPAAAADSLVVFWSRVDAELAAQEGSLAEEVPGDGSRGDQAREPGVSDDLLAVAQNDSLVAWADARLRALAEAGRPWVLRAGMAAPRFNRIQGLTPRVSLRLGRNGDPEPLARAVLGWGLAEEHADGRVTVGRPARTGSSPWGWRLMARSRARAFVAADRPLRDASALLYGSDPRSFVRDEAVGAAVTLALGARWSLRAGAEAFRHKAMTEATDWNLWGRDLDPENLVTADSVEGRAWTVAVGGQVAGWDIRAAATRWSGLDRPGRWRVEGDLGWTGLDGGGNTWRLRLSGRRWTRPAPLQEQFWQGGFDPAGLIGLAGWPAGRLRGNAAVTGAVTVELSADLLRAVRFPVLAGLLLQPVFSLEGAWAGDSGLWDDGAGLPLVGTSSGTPGSYAPGGPLGSVGVGLQRRLGVPLLGRRQHLRLQAAWPIGPGAEDSGMRFVVGLVD